MANDEKRTHTLNCAQKKGNQQFAQSQSGKKKDATT